jgi:hypothetical protein
MNVQLTEDVINVLKEFNRNIIWMKTRELKNIPLITANQLTKKTGWNKYELRRKRMRNEIYFEMSDSGGYRYKDVTLDYPRLPQSLS